MYHWFPSLYYDNDTFNKMTSSYLLLFPHSIDVGDVVKEDEIIAEIETDKVERERERERDRETEKRETERERQRDRETERDREEGGEREGRRVTYNSC